MWPRAIELMLGLWLVITPFVFRLPGDRPLLWVGAMVPGALVVVFSLGTFWHRLRRLHLASAALGLGLALHAFLLPRPLVPVQQNQLVLGILLLMFAIIPRRSSTPPVGWRGEGG